MFHFVAELWYAELIYNNFVVRPHLGMLEILVKQMAKQVEGD
jgi:argininosuccinate synthase